MDDFIRAYKDRFGVTPEILEVLAADAEKIRAVVLHKNGPLVEMRAFTAWRGGHIGE